MLDLPQTSDFVVVVVGLEAGLTRSELDSYLPAEKLALLHTRGWL